MNLANKITFSRIVLSIVIMILLLFPFEGLGVELPTYLVNGTIYVELKYIVAFDLLYYCGLRRGELLGLTWEYIDLNKNQINYILRPNIFKYKNLTTFIALSYNSILL